MDTFLFNTSCKYELFCRLTGLADSENRFMLDKLQQRCKCTVVLIYQAGKCQADTPSPR